MLNFYRFLSLEIGTSHGFILRPLIFAEQGGVSMWCMGGDLGRGRRNLVSHMNLTIETISGSNLPQTKKKHIISCKKFKKWKKETKGWDYNLTGTSTFLSVLTHLCIFCPEVVYSVASLMVQWSEVLWLENPRHSCSDTSSLLSWKKPKWLLANNDKNNDKMSRQIHTEMRIYTHPWAKSFMMR